MSTGDLEAEQRSALANEINRLRKLKGWTIQALADKSRLEERTIRNVLHGNPVRLATIHAICTALGMSPDQIVGRPHKIASEKHGAYNLADYRDYVGQFYSVRRNYTEDRSIFRSIFDLHWSDTSQCLVFAEMHRYFDTSIKRFQDWTQTGEVFISNQMNTVHLTTVTKGAIRLITLTKMLPPELDTMEGAVLTQSRSGAYIRPSVSPTYLTKLKSPATNEQLEGLVGPLYRHDDGYAEFSARLDEVERNTVLFARSGTGESGELVGDPSLRPIARQ